MGFKRTSANLAVSQDRIGLLYEHLLLNQIINSARANDLACQVWLFRTRAGAEIDFIVKLEDKWFAIDAKTSGPSSKSEIGGFESFTKLWNKDVDQYVATLEMATPRKIGAVHVRHWQELLKEMGLCILQQRRSASRLISDGMAEVTALPRDQVFEKNSALLEQI